MKHEVIRPVKPNGSTYLTLTWAKMIPLKTPKKTRLDRLIRIVYIAQKGIERQIFILINGHFVVQTEEGRKEVSLTEPTVAYIDHNGKMIITVRSDNGLSEHHLPVNKILDGKGHYTLYLKA